MKMSLPLTLLTVMLMSVGCKPMHRQDSDVSYAASNDGTLLTAVKGEREGICLLQSSNRHPDEHPRLLTVSGSISSDQLKKALRFMGYGEAIAAVIVPALVGAAITVPSIVKGAKASIIGDQDHALKAAAKMPVALAVGLTVGVGGMLGYHIIKGNVEGEKAAPIAARTTLASFTGVLFSPIVESSHRSGRLTSVLSDKEQWNITNRKMRKLIERIRDTNPEFHGGCDHIRDELKDS